MPLIKHQISPIYLSRRPPPFAEDETGGEPPPPGDSDLRGVANLTLCGVLRQMGSLMQAAKNIEREITLDLEQVVARVEKLSEKLHGLTVKVETFNPRDVPLPEDDLRSFSKRTLHFRSTTHSLPPPTTDIPPSINSSSSCLSTPRVTFFPCSVQPTSTSSMDRRVLKKRVIALQTPGGTPTPLNCSLNSTMNFSSVTVHANTTASTLDAINSMNVASSIFGGSEGLFTKDNRPVEVRSLYTGAGNDSPLSHMRAMGLKRCDGVRSSKYYSCQPVTIGNTIKREKSIRLNLDIETRRPASFDALRDWCSDDEAPYHPLLDPVSPVVDRSSQIVSPSPSSGCDQDSPTLSHKLPRPEQLFKLLSAKYPPEVVSIDVSGGGFRRMETVRQSLCQYDYVKTKRRRKRVKRRNTIADSRDARKASLSQSAAKRRLNQTLDQPSTSSGRGLSSSPSEGYYFTDGPSFDPSFDTSEPCDSSVSSKRLDHKELRSGGVQFDFKSTSALTSRDLFKRTNTFRDESIEAIVEASTPECSSSVTTTALVHTPARQREECTGSSSGNWSASSSVRNSVELESQQTKANKRVTDDETLVEVIDRLSLSTHNNYLPDSSTSTPQLSDRNLSTTAQPSDREDSFCQQSDRTLTPTSCLHCHEFCEECSSQTPLTHSPSAQRHSSSPDSPPSGSLVCPSHSRTTDGLPSYTSDGTLTPTQDIQEIPSFDDDTSSAYSCDTEGYYTSFHLDSGIRSASEDKLMSSGSVGTITSNSSVASLGTVVMRNPEKKTPPKPPQRVSSLDRKNSGSNRESIITVIHVNGSAGSSREDVTKSVSEAVDSGRETSSSANDPNSPRTLSVTSPEADGSSDCDTSERKDSFRSKTAINASGIPSMCVITPPLSDDESVRSAQINTSARTSEDPSLGSVAAKALLFQGTNNSSAPNTVRQVPRIETGKVSPHSNNSSGGSTPVSKQDSKNQSKTLFHSTSVDYSVNVRPSVMKQSDITRRLSADITPTAAPSPQPKILKVPPPPPPREDSIDSSSRRIDGNEQPISAVPPTVKQNLVITPTNSLERKKLKSSGAHVTLDSEGKVVYSSDSLQRRKKAQQQDAYKQQQNVSSNLSNIQQMPLPAPPADNTAEVTALQQQQLQQQLLQQQQIQQQQQAYMLQQEQEEKLMKQRQEEMMLSRAVQEQIVQSKQEMIHQQNSLKQQHQELQQQLAETRIELQRQQQEQQQKLQALRERQAYLQSKTPAAKQSTLERNKGQKQSLKESNKDVAKQQQALKTQELQRQTLIEQQKQIQLAEQQKQVQLQKQQQQQLLQQQQQYLQQQYQQQQQAIYGQRQDPYLFPTVPQTNSGGGALSQIPPIVPPPPPADSRQLSESSGVIMAASGNPMSPRSQRAAAGAYVHMTDQTQGAMPTNNMSVQGFTQMQQQQQLQMQQARMQQQQQYPSRPHSSQGLYGPTSERGQTARSSTPVQGATVSSSPRHSPAVPPPPVGATPQQIAMHHSQLRANAGMMYGSQRSLQNYGVSGDLQQQQVATYQTQMTISDSDIYGRIGMTRQVHVGEGIPPGFGRHHRGYTSLPPGRRGQQAPTAQYAGSGGTLGRDSKTVSRRASVAGDSQRSRSAASNPSTPEKLLEKEKKASKKEKDKKKKEAKEKEKEKDKDKENKDAKSEKSPKKKWFWTLPLRRKKKNKDENEDDDGGFKDASLKGTRKAAAPVQDPNTGRYPESTSSDMNSSHSSEMSMDYSSYRSSPSSEVNYYNQRAQYLQQQQQAHQQQLLQLQQQQQQQLLQQQTMLHHQHLQQQVGGNLRSLPTTPTISSPPDTQPQQGGSFVSSSPSMGMNSSDVTDLTGSRRYMSREEMYSAMRHPQYYNQNRHSYAGTATQASDEANNNNASGAPAGVGRSQSPAVFGINPLPSNTVRPTVRSNSAEDYVSRDSQDTPIPFIFKENGFDDLNFGKVDPPAGYGEGETSDEDDDEKTNNIGGLSSNNSSSKVKPFAKQTSRFDFKKMILQQSMSTATNKDRVSAVEMLRASRPSIYGYAPPPAPIIKPQQQQPQAPERADGKPPTIEGVIMPPSSRNTARALLFQSRFGSGRRFRASKTEIISTTILEDHGGEVSEELSMEEESEEEESDEEDGQSNGGNTSDDNLICSPNRDPTISAVMHSTPQTTKAGGPPQMGDISSIEAVAKTEGASPPDESMETAL